MTETQSIDRVPWYRGLFVLMAGLFVLALNPFGEIGWVRAVLSSTVLVAAVWSACGTRLHRIVGIVICAPALVLTWIADRQEIGVLGAWSATVVAVFFAYIIVAVLVQLVRTRTATAHTIWAGVCVYLLIPLLWTRLYEILIHVSETPYNVFRGMGTADWTLQLSYYSFVTLTTLGFGDITPLTLAARRLTTLEAVVGQLFLAIFIARLVGLHLAERLQTKGPTTP